uniref:Uncharacterized protein n=1 Tax=Cacopsylla melanoneura TaxID=428564 RepID=A0A8D8W0J1_9HEMI
MRSVCPGVLKFLGDPLGPKPELPTKFHQNRMGTVGEKAVSRICGQTDRRPDRPTDTKPKMFRSETRFGEVFLFIKLNGAVLSNVVFLFLSPSHCNCIYFLFLYDAIT